MVDTINISLLDQSWSTFDCPRDVTEFLSDHFTYELNNFKHTPTYKRSKGKWDGSIHLYKKRGNKLYTGLILEAARVLMQNGYKVNLDKKFSQFVSGFNREDVEDFVKLLKPPFTPTEEQIDSIYQCVRTGRRVILSPTGSGKSFIIYCLIMWFRMFGHSTPKKTLIIVPLVGLVNQTIEAFKGYGMDVDKLISTDPSNPDKPILITTWQSIYKNDPEYFKQFGCVIGDEVHHFKATSLSKIMESCIYAAYRWGLTGTLDDVEVNRLIIEGHFGPAYRATTTKKLIDKEFLSKLDPIELVHVDYNRSDRLEVYNNRKEYNDEVEFICAHESRNQMVVDLVKDLPGNTLVLFGRVESQGIPLYERFKDQMKGDRDVFYISGATDKEEREIIRHKVNGLDKSVIVGSAGTMSTGIDIPNLHNLILVLPGKAKIKLLQAIGRVLRKAKNGQAAKVIDIIDDLTCSSRKNHALRHAQKRVDIYTSEGFKIKVRKMKFGPSNGR